MIDAKKLQCYTMAYRLRGYAEGLDEDRHEALVASSAEVLWGLAKTTAYLSRWTKMISKSCLCWRLLALRSEA